MVAATKVANAPEPAFSLDLIQIASPCDASWEEMPGDERVRRCAACKRDVYNLAEMTHAEATALLAERTGRTCIRLYRRIDGTVLTKDCPRGLAAIRGKLLRLALSTAALLLASVATTLAALGKIPGMSTYISQSRVEQLRNVYAPAPVALGGCPAPPMPTPAPVVGSGLSGG